MQTENIIPVIILLITVLIVRFLYKLNKQHETEGRILRNHEYETD